MILRMIETLIVDCIINEYVILSWTLNKIMEPHLQCVFVLYSCYLLLSYFSVGHIVNDPINSVFIIIWFPVYSWLYFEVDCHHIVTLIVKGPDVRSSWATSACQERFQGKNMFFLFIFYLAPGLQCLWGDLVNKWLVYGTREHRCLVLSASSEPGPAGTHKQFCTVEKQDRLVVTHQALPELRSSVLLLFKVEKRLK